MTATGSELIHAERIRQILDEGWGADHDDHHVAYELPRAAKCYVEAAIWAEHGLLHVDGTPPQWWPWEDEWWRPSDDPIRNLVKAGSLIAAEIDRIQRAQRSDG